MSNEWDDKLTEKFLNLYQKHKCLWNPYSPNYRNCLIKNKAFETVVQELNLPGFSVTRCLQQIDVIREKYRQEQLEVENKLKTGQLYTPKLSWFTLMSQMLREVIDDEESFGINPVKYTPCMVATNSKQHRNYYGTFTAQGELSDLQPKYIEGKLKAINPNNCITPEKVIEYTNSGYVNLRNTSAQNHNYPVGPRAVNDACYPYNRCPSCGWEKGNAEGRISRKTNEFNNCYESRGQIEPALGTPALMNDYSSCVTGERYQSLPVILCENATEHTSCESKMPEVDVAHNRKKLQTDADVSRSAEVITSISNYVRTPPNDGEVNVVKCSRGVDNVNQTRCMENLELNLDINPTDHRVVQIRSNVVLYPNTNKVDEPKLCSSFKIIIPNSHHENQNLEPKYVHCPDSENSEVVITENEPACQTQLSISNTNTSRHLTRHCSIKLDMRSKNSKYPPRKNLFRTAGTMCTRVKADKKIGHISKSTEQHKSGCNQKTQTDRCHENVKVQTLLDTEGSTLNCSNSFNYHECDKNASIIHESSCCPANCGTSTDDEEICLDQDPNTLKNETTANKDSSAIGNGAIPAVETLSNTRLFLQVILNILNYNDVLNNAMDLQEILVTMHDTFQLISSNAQCSTGNCLPTKNGDEMVDDTVRYVESEPHEFDLPDRELQYMNPQKPNNNIVEPEERIISDSRTPSLPIEGLPGDSLSFLLLPGEANNVVNENADENRNEENARLQGGSKMSIIERPITNQGPPATYYDRDISLDSTFDQAPNYTRDFKSGQLSSSSSKRISELQNFNPSTQSVLEMIERISTLMDDMLNNIIKGNNEGSEDTNK